MVVVSKDPEISRNGLISIQVCVPRQFTDEQVIEFANKENHPGLDSGWVIRRESDALLNGDREREPCSKLPSDKVHIMLDC